MGELEVEWVIVRFHIHLSSSFSSWFVGFGFGEHFAHCSSSLGYTAGWIGSVGCVFRAWSLGGGSAATVPLVESLLARIQWLSRAALVLLVHVPLA